MVKDVTTYSDSYWASVKETPKSSSAGVILLGSHTLNAYTRNKISLQGAARKKNCTQQRSERLRQKGMVSLLCDLGYVMKPVLTIVAKATEHILHRQGSGRSQHIDVAYLKMQDEVRSKMLRVRRVKSEENMADLGTTPSKATIAKQCIALACVNMAEEQRSEVLVRHWVRCRTGKVQMFVTDNRAVSLQSFGDHAKRSAHGSSSSDNGSSSSTPTSSR